MMVLDARKERGRLERAEAVKVERVLVDVLDATELTQDGYEHIHDYETGCQDMATVERRPGCDLAPELLAKLAARGYRLVKIDPFEPAPAKSGRVVPIEPLIDIPACVVDLARRVEEIEGKLATWVPQEQA